jgi:hypothetical protein
MQIFRASPSVQNYGSQKKAKELGLVYSHDGFQINCKNEITSFIRYPFLLHL